MKRKMELSPNRFPAKFLRFFASRGKRLLSVALCALSALALGGCESLHRGETPPSSIKIGLALYDQYDTFIGEITQYFLEYARETEQESGVRITVLRDSAEGNQEAQNTQVEDFIKAGCDVLCVNIVDRMDAAMIIDRAEAAQIPVIFFNRELVEEDLQRNDMLYYVGADAAQSGRMQGEMVAAICGYAPGPPESIDQEAFARVDKNGDGVIQYVMLEGEADHQDAVVRTESALAALKDAGIQIERLESEIANWVRSQAETKMQEWLRAYGNDIEVVLANNDDMALGAIDALKRAGISGEMSPVVVGIDGTSVGLKAVAAGDMAATVHNDANGQAKSLMELAFAIAGGGPMPELTGGKYIRLPYRMVWPDNVEDFM